MIDYIRLQSSNTEVVELLKNKISNNYELNPTSSYNLITGESSNNCKGNFYNMYISATENTGTISNSIHKMFNLMSRNEEHNYNDFNYTQLCYALDSLEEKIGVNLNEFKVNGLELGMNIKINRPPIEVLNNFTYLYNYENFNQNRKYNNKLSYYSHQFEDYSIKFYDKGYQYKLNKNILRFEVKINRSRKLEKFEIYKVEDLKDKVKLNQLFEFFINCFDKIMLLDFLNENDEICEKERKLFLNGRNATYWREIKKDKSATTLSNHKKQFHKIVSKYQLNSIHQELRQKLERKFIELLNPPNNE